MADIGALLLPDINLMGAYEQSFQRQQALKQYVVQKSEKNEDKFWKDNTVSLDDSLGAIKGVQNVMTAKLNDHMAKVQKAFGDNKRGPVFHIDPKTNAELQMDAFKLQAEQAQYMNEISKLNSARSTINNPAFASTHDIDHTNNWIKQLQEGKHPEGEPIQTLPMDGGKALLDLSKELPGRNKYDTPHKGLQYDKYGYHSGLVKNFDPNNIDKSNQEAYNSFTEMAHKNNAIYGIAQADFAHAANKDPNIVKQFASDPDPAWSYFVAKNSAVISGITKATQEHITDKPYKSGGSEYTKDKHTLFDEGNNNFTVPTSGGKVTIPMSVDASDGGTASGTLTSISPSRGEATAVYQGKDLDGKGNPKTNDAGQVIYVNKTKILKGAEYTKAVNTLKSQGKWHFDTNPAETHQNQVQSSPQGKPTSQVPQGKYPPGVDANGNGKDDKNRTWKHGKIQV